MLVVNEFLLQRAKQKTKISSVPSAVSEDYEIIRDLIRYGVNVVRLNLSHGTHEEHRARVAHVRQAAEELNLHVGIMFDIEVRDPDRRCD